MMKTTKVFLILAVLACIITSCFEIDSRYEAAGLLDNQTIEMAQKMMANIEDTDIDVISTLIAAHTDFTGQYAEINADENWIKPYFSFYSEDMSSYPNAPSEINGVIVAKMKSKDQIDADFNIVDNETQGTCGDVQRVIYAATLALLTDGEKERYLTKGKQLSIIQDNSTENPDIKGDGWLGIDPADMITNVGDQYYYEPPALYISLDNPFLPEDADERFLGVYYCKLLSHQAILSWMLTKSFQNDPALLTKSDVVCTDPTPRITTLGSCLFFFKVAGFYYCSDYTGSDFTPESAAEKCAKRSDEAVYSPDTCSERTEEIEAFIPDYQGHTGLCTIHCMEGNEFIWNVYTENPEDSCGDYDFFYPEDIAEITESE